MQCLAGRGGAGRYGRAWWRPCWRCSRSSARSSASSRRWGCTVS